MQCDLPKISIHYESKGRGRPVLVLHGSPGNAAQAMTQLEPAFEGTRKWRRIYPDLPGHGKTPGTDRIRNIDDYLGVLLEFVDEVLPGGRFSLGGTSFGAYLALGVARKRAGRINGLMLSAPMVNFGPREDLRGRRSGSPISPSPERTTRGRADYAEDTAWLETLPYRDLAFDLYHHPEPFRSPALFLFGRQDAPFRHRDYWKLLPGFPRATFAVLDNAGHSLWETQREVSGALVREWLTRVEAWEPSVPRAP